MVLDVIEGKLIEGQGLYINHSHGHGSQSLINLLLTGSATQVPHNITITIVIVWQNVFDGTKDLCGLKLEGISRRSSVGFLSYLECLRYLEVDPINGPLYPPITLTHRWAGTLSVK